MFFRKFFNLGFSVLLIAECAVFSSCFVNFVKINANERRSNNSAETDKITITASFYPLYIMLLNLCDGTDLKPEMLAPSDTGCLHDYQLTTRDMQKISSSDCVVLNGAGMEDFLDKVYESKKTSEGAVISASDGFNSFVTDADGAVNPHVWVSVDGAISQVNWISSKLAERYPSFSEKILKNAESYTKELEELKTAMHSELDKYRGETIITFHEAFPYFANEFGLSIAGVIEREPGTAPSPKELSEIIQFVNESNKAAVKKVPLFVEPQYSSASAEIISNETGSAIYELDPCVTGALGKDSYVKAMKKNLEVLRKAFAQ